MQPKYSQSTNQKHFNQINKDMINVFYKNKKWNSSTELSLEDAAYISMAIKVLGITNLKFIKEVGDIIGKNLGYATP